MMMEECVRKLLAEMNRLSNPSTWVGSATDIGECMLALENYQPDSIQGLEQRVAREIDIQIPELRNIFRYDRGTQQKRDEFYALTPLFEYAEFELPFQCPLNSPQEISADIDLSILTPRVQIRQLCSKFYSSVRGRRILFYTGSQWDQLNGYLDATPVYKPLLEDYDSLHRRRVLERAFADVYSIPNLTGYVSKREIGIRFPKVKAS